jgi:hypothetical protein
MPLADKYTGYAAECVRVAQQTTNPNDKLLLLQMAETWRRVAERTEACQGSVPKGTEDIL